MPLTISNNSAVASASYYLGKNQQALQHSIKTVSYTHLTLPTKA